MGILPDKDRFITVTVEDGYVVLDRERACYEIELSRIDDHEALLVWVFRLSKKNWVTSDVIHRFIIAVSDAKGWRLWDGGFYG